MTGIDWKQVLLPGTPVLEILVRGTLMYLGLFMLLRLILKRQPGTLGLSDLLVVVLIADAAQSGMAGQYRSVADGMILVATIIFWSFALDWLGYRFPAMHKLVHPPPLQIIRDGKMMFRNMRKELITSEELMASLRQQGLESAEEVKEAFMEGDGRISFVPYEKSGSSQGSKERKDPSSG